MTRVIVHAGFHKTGTTTAQRFLMENGAHIWPDHAIVTQHRIHEPLKMTLAYSTGAGQLALDEFRFRLTECTLQKCSAPIPIYARHFVIGLFAQECIDYIFPLDCLPFVFDLAV